MNLRKLSGIIILAALLSQSAPQPLVGAAEKEPVDLVFDEILAMYQDLEADKLMQLSGGEPRYRSRIDFSPRKAAFFKRAHEKHQFNNAELAMLGNNGFFVRDTGWYGGFGVIYYNIYANDLPVLVTTDSLLHALHKSYDDILKELEEEQFHPAIGRVLAVVREELQAMARSTTDPVLSRSLVDADTYLTVALSLLSGRQEAALLGGDSTVGEVLGHIDSLTMLVPLQDPPVKLFGEDRWVDFSQFKPRGHYSQSEALRRYFRCLMWLGRADTGMNVLASKRQLRAAALLVHALKTSGQDTTLHEMDEVINFMVGRSDNLTVGGLAGLLEEVGLDRAERLTDAAFIKAVQEGIADGRAGAQMIRSQMVVSWPDDQVKVSPPSLFQLFGQRYIIDSFVLSKVVYDDIIYKGVKQQRTMPSPLDVMAALGNGEALTLLWDELERWNYSGNLKALQDFIASHKEEFWQDNLYNLWLDALVTLHRTPTGKHVPQAMQTRAWARKQLNTQLASWAQLRHDTILYAKQSYTAGVGCEYPKGFVEPYPDFYRKLGFFARQAGRLLGNASFIEKSRRTRYDRFFNNMEKTMSRLEALADKELEAEPFTGGDQAWLETLIRRRNGDGYGATPVYNGWYVDLFYGGQEAAIEWDPTVADIHTDPNTRQVLEVGVGRINTLFMVVDNEDDRALYAGPTFSYYQFHQPAEKRMTDPEWKEMLTSDRAPERPAWTQSFMP